jgi:ribonuclease HI
MSDERPRIRIYTDGGADPNPGPGGWGAVLIHPQKTRELSGGHPDTTNNRMELTAAIEALKALTRPCVIDLYTDSQYLQHGIENLAHKWAMNGWRDSKGEPVINGDLWQELYELRKQHDITWHWVRGHAGNHYNERAHQLASAAMPRKEQTIDPNITRVYLQIAGPKKGSTGTCGWAARVLREDQEETFYGGHPNMSVNGFNLWAVLQLLNFIPPDEPIQFFTSNSYIYDGITQWVEGWRKGNWVKPPKFKPEWQALDRENQRRQIKWYRVQGEEPAEFAGLSELAHQGREEASNG